VGGFSQIGCLIALSLYALAAIIASFLVKPWWAGALAGILGLMGVGIAAGRFGRRKSE
jgi:hypothetical protein